MNAQNDFESFCDEISRQARRVISDHMTKQHGRRITKAHGLENLHRLKGAVEVALMVFPGRMPQELEDKIQEAYDKAASWL